MKKELRLNPMIRAKGVGLIGLGVVFALVAQAVAQTSVEQSTEEQKEPSDVTECVGAASSLLRYKKLALNRREKTLANRELDIEKAEERLAQQFKELEDIRESLRKTMSSLDLVKEDRIKKLKGRFEKMRPKEAATILEKTDDTVSILLLAGMKADKSGKILAKMAPEKAALLTEKLAKHPINK